MRVPITKPWFDDDDRAAVQAPLETGWVVQGPYVQSFEQQFAAFAGVDAAVACTSCTTALHLAYAALGIGPGDEVIVPSFTWVSTASAAIYCGATPILVDVELKTFNVDPAAVEAAVTPRTRAIVPVHLFGLPAKMDPIMAIAKRHGLAVVEDGACALGSRWRGQHVGTLGDVGVFSFHPRKAVTTGEGGMAVARDPAHVDRMRIMRNHGAGLSGHARHGQKDGFLLGAFAELGFNYRLTDIQGALGCSQMKKVPAALAGRRARAARYDRLLSEFDWLQTPDVPAHVEHSFQSYVCRFAPERPTLDALDDLNGARDAVMRYAAEAGVSTRQGTHAVHALEFYARRFGYAASDLPGATMAERLSVTLPLYPQMTDAEQDYVVEVLAAGFEKATRG